VNSNNLISNTELRTLYPTSLNSGADKAAEPRMNEVAGRMQLRGTLEMNLNTNFTGTFKLLLLFYTFLSSATISILAGQKCMSYYTHVCVYLHMQRERFFFSLEIGAEIYLDGGF